MSAFIVRHFSHNLTKQFCRGSQSGGSCLKGLLSPSSTLISIDRGAKLDCGITWVRPEEPPSVSKAKSGDLEGAPKVSPEAVIPELRDSEIFKKASPEVQKLFTFKFQPRDRRRVIVQSVLQDKVKRHVWDFQSPEVYMATFTANIRRMQEHHEKFPRDKKSKRILKELIEKRKKHLKKMRLADYRQFEYILERLNLEYYPYPPLNEGGDIKRREAMGKLADTFCEEIREKRFKQYRDELEARKPVFLRRKADTMRAIIADEQSLGVSPSFTEEEILEVEKLYEAKLAEEALLPPVEKDIF